MSDVRGAPILGLLHAAPRAVRRPSAFRDMLRALEAPAAVRGNPQTAMPRAPVATRA